MVLYQLKIGTGAQRPAEQVEINQLGSNPWGVARDWTGGILSCKSRAKSVKAIGKNGI